MVPVNDETEYCDLCSEATETHNGIGWRIEYCPLHSSAEKLRDKLIELSRCYGQEVRAAYATRQEYLPVRLELIAEVNELLAMAASRGEKP